MEVPVIAPLLNCSIFRFCDAVKSTSPPITTLTASSLAPTSAVPGSWNDTNPFPAKVHGLGRTRLATWNVCEFINPL